LASIRKRGDSYKITVSNGYDTSGKQIRETTTFTPDSNMTEKQNKKALEHFAYEFEEKVRNGSYLSGEKINLKDFSEKWLKEYATQQLEKTTVTFYKQSLDQKILPALGHIKLAKLQPMHLQSFYNNLLEDGIRMDGKKGGYSPATIKKYHAIISSILSTAIQWQVIDKNPCDRVTPPRNKNITDDVKHFTLEQTERFLYALEMDYTTEYKAHSRKDDTGKRYTVPAYTETRSIPTQFKILYQIAVYGGLRRGELVALKWDDIDFENNTINITKAMGYTGSETYEKAPKTRSSIRVIKIPKPIMEQLRKYKKEQQELRLSLGDQWQGENHLFIQWNGKQMHIATPYHTFKDIIAKYNKTVTDESQQLPSIPLHGLRHTSATLLISENVDVRTVSARLGHSQTSTTMNIYAHSLKEMDQKASDALDNLIKFKAK